MNTTMHQALFSKHILYAKITKIIIIAAASTVVIVAAKAEVAPPGCQA